MHRVLGLVESEVKIHLYGVGGTGGHVLNGLARMQHALLKVGHPGIYVDAFDPDVVTYDNIGRQIFTEYDVGKNKAKVAMERLNVHCGLRWCAHGAKNPSSAHRVDLIIACVDTKKSRRGIDQLHVKDGTYIIDVGNSRDSGQVILGQRNGALPDPYENKELLEGEEDDTAPCADPYQKQDLFINQLVATYALDLVWKLLRRGKITQRGVFASLSGLSNPIKC